MQRILKCFLFSLIVGAILVPPVVSAKLGVGVGTGKIEFDKPLNMGGVYEFPPLTVINSGDEASDYGVGIDFKDDPILRSPAKEWFVFTPDSFHLEPGQSQVVHVKTSIPVKTIPGNYFAYLEAHPDKSSQSAGGAVIGISAAAKMYFTIAPANIFQGIYYRVISILKNSAPWSYVILVAIAMSISVALFRKYFSFSIGISRKEVERNDNENLEK